MRLDARIPVRFIHPIPESAIDRIWADQLLLLPQEVGLGSPPGWLAVLRLPPLAIGSPQPGHRSGCRCCTPRSEPVVMLTRLVQDRARGQIGFFRGIVASLPQGETASLRTIIECDPYLSSCFANADQQRNQPNPELCAKD